MNIFENKPVVATSWNLCIQVEPGMMIEDSWHPNAQINMSDWEFSSLLDGNILTKVSGITKTICIAKNIEDTTTQDHLLVFALQNANNIEHQMLKLKIEIEHVDIGVILEQSGQYILNDMTVKTGGLFMGENGYQQLAFTTPIYRWLLDNRYSIINSYKSNVIK